MPSKDLVATTLCGPDRGSRRGARGGRAEPGVRRLNEVRKGDGRGCLLVTSQKDEVLPVFLVVGQLSSATPDTHVLCVSSQCVNPTGRNEVVGRPPSVASRVDGSKESVVTRLWASSAGNQHRRGGGRRWRLARHIVPSPHVGQGRARELPKSLGCTSWSPVRVQQRRAALASSAPPDALCGAETAARRTGTKAQHSRSRPAARAPSRAQ